METLVMILLLRVPCQLQSMTPRRDKWNVWWEGSRWDHGMMLSIWGC